MKRKIVIFLTSKHSLENQVILTIPPILECINFLPKGERNWREALEESHWLVQMRRRTTPRIEMWKRNLKRVAKVSTKFHRVLATSLLSQNSQLMTEATSNSQRSLHRKILKKIRMRRIRHCEILPK